MKKEIEVFDYAKEITQAIGKGILLTTKAGDKVNTMTIGWGTLGVEWATPIFTVFVRENRFTKQLLEKNPEFTINIPYGEVDKQILSVCGTPIRARLRQNCTAGPYFGRRRKGFGAGHFTAAPDAGMQGDLRPKAG